MRRENVNKSLIGQMNRNCTGELTGHSFMSRIPGNQIRAETTDLTGFGSSGRKVEGHAVEASERREEGLRCSGDGASSLRRSGPRGARLRKGPGAVRRL
jgi:hypothetical protein